MNRLFATPTGHAGPAAALLLCGVLWSIGGLLIKFIEWPELAIWSARSGIAAAVLYAVVRPRFVGMNRADWGAAILYSVTTLLFIAANKHTTAANAILIQYAAPVWVALAGARLLSEPTASHDWVFLFATLIGVMIFFAGDIGSGGMLGNGFALAASFTFAGHVMCLRRAHDPIRAFIVGGAIAALLGLPFLLTAPAPTTRDVVSVMLLGVVQQAAAALLFAWAIRRVTALAGLLLPMLEPILSVVWVALVLGEMPGPWAWVGGALVLASTLARALWRPALPVTSAGEETVTHGT